MCIYCTTNNYRKIYEHHHGAIPVDSTGRTYEIHHIDGNHTNNEPKNLKAVTIQEHFEIHLSQGDYGACQCILQRMNMPKDLISQMASLDNQKRVAAGTHNFLGGDLQRKTARKLIENGTLNLLSGEIQRRAALERVKNGTHPLVGGEVSRKTNLKRLEEGTHQFLDKERARENNLKRVANGSHPFLGGEVTRKVNQKMIAEGSHPFQQPYTCPHCGKEGRGPNMQRYHFDKCKHIIK